MKRFAALIIVMTVFQLTFGSYMYGKGSIDGIARYRQSKNFMLTLYSMYVYGLRDACDASLRCKDVNNLLGRKK